jgi:hypothetical protein
MSPVKHPTLIYSVLAAAFLLASQAPAGASETGYFSPPGLDGFSLHGEEEGDGDGDGTRETHIKRYYNPAGDSIFNMTTKGRLWAWSQSSAANSSDLMSNYVIRDSNCDGLFDERYGLDEEYHIPDCLK